MRTAGGFKNGAKGALAVFILLAGISGAGLWALRPPAGQAGDTVRVVIAPGSGVPQISQVLKEQELIRSPAAFKLLARMDRRGAHIQAGTYDLRRGLRLDQVLKVLAAGPAAPPTFRVTIPEGLTVAQSLQRIADAEGSPFEVAELTAALKTVPLPAWVPAADLPAAAEPYEGLLFPDTYDFRLDAEPEQVLARLVERTDAVVADLTESSGLDPYKTITLASLVEREARLPSERARISSVIYNRLQQELRLQIDATVLYALGEQKPQVLRRDLQIESPWNTYRNVGLPPTPISGVGRASISAAAQPSNEDYLYYVVEDPVTGRHRFSRTFAEHQQAIAEIRDS